MKHQALLMTETCLLGLFSGSCALWAQDSQADLDDEYRAGLLATYQAADGTKSQRVDSRLAFSWQQSGPDLRISTGPFSSTWQGYLMSQVQGPYRLAAYVKGQLQLKLNGELLLDGENGEAGWLVSKPVELPFDWHPINITYRSRDARGQLVLYWTGPGFQWEPIAPKHWYHDPQKTPKNRFDRGHQLVRALRCTQCPVSYTHLKLPTIYSV